MNIVKIFSYAFFIFLGYLFLSQQIHISHIKKLTQTDLDTVHQSITKYYSSLNDNENSTSFKNIDAAYQVAQNGIKSMNSSTDHNNIIKNYIAMLDDEFVRFLPTTSSAIDDSTNQEFHIIALPSNIGKLKIPVKTCCPCITDTNRP